MGSFIWLSRQEYNLRGFCDVQYGGATMSGHAFQMFLFDIVGLLPKTSLCIPCIQINSYEK